MKKSGRLFVFLFFAFLYAPILVLMMLSFNQASQGAAWTGFTLDWYRKLWEDESIQQALWNSLIVATSASLLSCVLGTAAAMASVRGWRVSQKLIPRITLFPILMPDVVLGIALLCFFVWVTLPLGFPTIIMAHAACGTAYVAMMVKTRLLMVDPLVEDAAADLGARKGKVFFQIVLPQLKPALISGALLVFTNSFDDFIVAFFTSGVGATTLPLKIYSMLKFGVGPEVNALSSIILVMSICLVALTFWFQNSAQRRI